MLGSWHALSIVGEAYGLKKAPNASDNWLREFRKAGLEVVVGPFTLAKVQRIPLNKVELILCPVFVYTTSFHVVP